jgi:DNA-binding XRE family transcriptional regulator
MDWLNKNIGSRISELRNQAGYTQEELGQMLSLARASVINIEKGRHAPPISTIYTLCCIFKCTPNDLIPPIKEVNIKTKGAPIIKKIVRNKYLPVVIK